MSTETRNATDMQGWTKGELLRARFDIAVAVQHLVLIVPLIYAAVVGVSVWWSYFEMVEHGMSRAWWEGAVWGIVLAALWFLIFALIVGWTQRLVASIVHRCSRH